MEKEDIFNPRNKQFWVLLLLVLLGVMLMMLGSCGTGGADRSQSEGVGIKQEALAGSGQEDAQGESVMSREEKQLATGLRQMLESVSGVGRVEVSVSLATSTYNNYAINTTSGVKSTEETDQGGGTRQISEDTSSRTVVLSRNNQGHEGPVVERETAPEVAGVLVVAEGAEDPRVKAGLFRAVQVALGVEPHKVIVLPMNRGD